MLHKELNGTALCIADETSVGVGTSLRADRRRPHDKVAVVLIFVEWAQSCEVHARLSERDELAHDILNACQVNHSLNYVVRNLWHRSFFNSIG